MYLHTKLVNEHVNLVTGYSAVSTVQCLISLRTKKANFCSWEMIRKARHEKVPAVYLKFVEGSSDFNKVLVFEISLTLMLHLV